MVKQILSFILILITCTLQAQNYDANRYRTKIFNGSSGQYDVQYGSAPQWVFPYWNTDLKMDIYTPVGDNNTLRPLIIMAHSGGFLNGSKDVDDMVALCDSFARKGYVTASIAYRKGFNPTDGQSAERAVYRGIQDAKASIRYFKEFADSFNIDTNNIFFGGMSAGGYMALNVAYMDKESERPASTYGGGTVNDLGCLNCAGNNYNHSSEVKAILDYWGAVDDTLIIEPGDEPALIMHGENDPTVPFVYDHPFGLPTLPKTYGGQPISERMQNLGIPHEFYTSEGSLHMLDGSNNGNFDNPPNAFWSDTLLPRTQDFLIDLIEPKPSKISADSLTLCHADTALFEVTNDTSSYYKWGYNTAVSAVNASDSGSIALHFATSGSYDIYVLEFNRILCASDTLWFHVDVAPEVVADFTSSVSNLNEVQFTNVSTGGANLQWNFGDTTTSTDANPSHTYSANGSYSVQLIVTSAQGCSDTVTKEVTIEGLSVDNMDKQLIEIYPNPFRETIHVETASIAKNLSIVDVTGQVIWQKQPGQKTMNINTSGWSAGVYFIQITNYSGRAVNRKIIKQ